MWKRNVGYFFWTCDGSLWKIMPIFSSWKQNFRGFFGFWWEPLENSANIFLFENWIPVVFGLWWEPLENNASYLLFENRISVLLWWEPLENNANIFYLKTGFPCFFGLVMGTWKIIPISSIWKRNFRSLLCLWWNLWENNANIFYLKTGFPWFFWLVMGTSGK